MAVNQPPFNEDPSRASWEYELTSQFNFLEGRASALLNVINSKDELEALVSLLEKANAILERQDTALLYIQDDQPSPAYQQDFMWLQTNVNSDGDYSLWFCKEES